jgi:hypothetical protein
MFEGLFQPMHLLHHRRAVSLRTTLAGSHRADLSSFPSKYSADVFRGKFVAGLKTPFHAGALQFHRHLLPLAEPCAFASWLLFSHD